MSATDIVDVLRGGMWLLSDEQRREAADMLLALKARAEAAEDRAEAAEEVLHHIRQWCDAYPLDIFPEPDFIEARAALAERGMTLDALSAATARRVLEGLRRLTDETGPA